MCHSRTIVQVLVNFILTFSICFIPASCAKMEGNTKNMNNKLKVIDLIELNRDGLPEGIYIAEGYVIVNNKEKKYLWISEEPITKEDVLANKGRAYKTFNLTDVIDFIPHKKYIFKLEIACSNRMTRRILKTIKLIEIRSKE